MKNIQIALISFFLVFSLVGTTQAGKLQKQKKAIDLTMAQAMDDVDLVKTMHKQLDAGFLSSNHPYYTVFIQHDNYVVRVTGSYLEWLTFFKFRYTNADVKYHRKSPL